MQSELFTNLIDWGEVELITLPDDLPQVFYRLSRPYQLWPSTKQ